MKNYIFFILIAAGLVSCRNTDKTSGHGFLRVDHNNRYFMFDNGTSYIPVGFNRFVLYKQSEESIDSLLSLWADYGVNYLRVWVGVATNPETEVGKYDKNQMDWLDYIVKKCQDHGIYLTISFWNENVLRSDVSWGWNSDKMVYNHNYFASGTADSAADLLGIKDEDSWNAMKNRYAVFVNRWKDYPSVFMWDLVNDCKKTDAWKSAMYNYVRSIDDHNHIITLQYNTGKDPNGDMDCGSVRVYDYNPAGNDAEEMAKALFDRVLQALKHGDPVYCGEGGMDNVTGKPYDMERGFLHMLWGPLAVGAAGNLHSWVSPPKWLPMNMQQLEWIKGFSDFTKQIDWKNFNSRNMNSEISVADTIIRAYACGDGNRMLIYLMNDDPANEFNPVHATMKIASGSVKSPARINWIDIRTGKTVKEDKLDNEDMDIPVPGFRDGIFCYIESL